MKGNYEKLAVNISLMFACIALPALLISRDTLVTAIITIALFVGALLHELSHLLVCRWQGLPYIKGLGVCLMGFFVIAYPSTMVILAPSVIGSAAMIAILLVKPLVVELMGVAGKYAVAVAFAAAGIMVVGSILDYIELVALKHERFRKVSTRGW